VVTTSRRARVRGRDNGAAALYFESTLHEPEMDGTVDTATAQNFAERVMAGRSRILTELRKVIVGQDDVVDEVLIALFTGGHCLITGVPGLAKTLLIKTIAEILDLSFKRIQFTPHLMPSDITGTEILEEQHRTRHLRFVHRPIFSP